MKKKPKIIAVVGPTSSGKTSLSIAIAKVFNGAVVSADSRQVYRGLDIGTGKVTVEEMEEVSHHLLDIANPMEVYTAASFERDAAAAILDIQNRGCLPIIAGGSTFYIDILRGKLQSAPVPPNEKLRKELEQFSNVELFEKIKIADPRRASDIDPDNRRRLERALEIISAIGTVPESTKTESPYQWLMIGVDVEKELLHKNIQKRLLERMESGMIEEAERLHAEGVTYERMDSLGLEYRYLAKYLQKELSKDELIKQIELKNRQYAKRQMTWLKRDKSIEWFLPTDLSEIMQRVETFLNE
jgi:tRNA dimethylallyltransferase